MHRLLPVLIAEMTNRTIAAVINGRPSLRWIGVKGYHSGLTALHQVVFECVEFSGTFGKPSLLFIVGWPPVLRRPVEITVKSGHRALKSPCPLYPQKQTSLSTAAMSALGQ